jgi:hypothetical protein
MKGNRQDGGDTATWIMIELNVSQMSPPINKLMQLDIKLRAGMSSPQEHQWENEGTRRLTVKHLMSPKCLHRKGSRALSQSCQQETLRYLIGIKGLVCQ